MDFGSVLKSYRKNAKLTQEALAKAAGVSRSYLSDVEHNRYNPSVELLKKLSRSLSATDSERDNIFNSLMVAAGYSTKNPKDFELVQNVMKSYIESGDNSFISKCLKDINEQDQVTYKYITDLLLEYVQENGVKVDQIISELERLVSNHFGDFALYSPETFPIYYIGEIEQHIEGLKEAKALHHDPSSFYDKQIEILKKHILSEKEFDNH